MSKLEFESIEECSKFLEGDTFIYNDVECVVLSGAEECYVLGYKKAIDKAWDWIDYNNRNGGCNFDGLEEDFKNYMKGD